MKNIYKIEKISKLECNKCNSEFKCDIENGKNECWCFEYPNILPIKSDKCVCKKCIEGKLNGYRNIK